MSAARHAVDGDRTLLEGDLADGYRLCEQLSARLYREGDEHVASLARLPDQRLWPRRLRRLSTGCGRRLSDICAGLEDAGDKLTPRLAREREQLRSVVRRTCG